MEALPALPDFVFPQPDNPDDPNSGTSLTVEEARQLLAVITTLVQYIRIEYAKCGKQEAPPF